MAATVASFRLAFPELSDTDAFPDPMVQYRINVAARLMDAVRWGNLLDHGVHLYVAHHVSLAAQRARQAGTGKVPGGAQGIVQSKSVDKVSVSYDTASAAEDGAGFWNLTTYGQEWFRISRMVGAGPLQVSGPEDQVRSAAWAGPLAPFF